MLSEKNSLNKAASNRISLDFYPAQIYDTKSGTYVGYYVLNPTNGKMVRKRIKLNRIKNKRERLKYARKLVIEINNKLTHGWNPFLEQEAPRSFTLLSEAVTNFFTIKQKELSEDSVRSYKSVLKIFINWLINDFNTEKIYVLNITNFIAKKFLDYQYLEKNKSARVVNNYLSVLKTFWNWLIENRYSKANIFSGVKKKKEQPELRIFIEKDIREKIFDYFEKNDKRFLAVCYLTFCGLIRPEEILRLKSSDFDFEKNIIKIRAENSKTKKDRIVSMPAKLKLILLEIKVNEVPENFYVFSSGFKPGSKLIDSRAVGKKWDKMRKALNLGKEIQFYGLKDSGIIEMLRAGVSPEAVRDQAGHSSLEMTNKYVQLARDDADVQLLEKINF